MATQQRIIKAKEELRKAQEESFLKKVRSVVGPIFDSSLDKVSDTFNTLVSFSKEHDKDLKEIKKAIPKDSTKEIEQVSEEVKSLKEVIKKKDFRGPKGDSIKGDKGDTPVKGRDYFTRGEIAEFKKEIAPIKGVDYKDGRNPLTVSRYKPNNPRKGDLWYKED